MNKKPASTSRLALIAIASFALLAACAAPPQAPSQPAQPTPPQQAPGETPKPTATAAGQPKAGGVLRVGTNQDAVGFDPHLTNATASFRILENIYSQLLKFTPNLEIEGDLAESYRAIDATTWEFKLRKNVKFHSGKPLTSADVKYSLERIKDPAVKSPRSSQLEAITAIETPDDYTVIIKTDKPYAPLLAVLADRTTAIVNKDFIEANGGKLDNVADGTGPFKLKEWVPNTRTVLEKNPDYFIPGQPLLDQVIYQPIPDDTARSTAVRTGSVDFIEYAPAKDLELLRSDPNIVITGEGNNNVRFLAFNTKVKPFDDPRVRRAIAWAVDREAVLQAAVNGAGTPLYAGPFLPSFWPGLKEPVYTRDLNKARQLLAEAGYPNGFTAKLKNTPTYSFLGNAGIAIQEQLKEIGINFEIESLEWSVFLKEYLVDRNFEAVVSGYSGFADPHIPLDGTYVTGRKNNFMNYSNPKLDELVAKGAQETDLSKRAEIYREIQKILLEDSPMVFLYAANEYEAMQSYVKGYVHYLNGSHVSFRQVWLDK
jgi:peptide/nickel transport system substrate-binding protein